MFLLIFFHQFFKKNFAIMRPAHLPEQLQDLEVFCQNISILAPRNYKRNILHTLLSHCQISQLDEALSFWKQNSCRSPTLSRMARDYYAIPASSAPAERLFSTAGHLNSKKRNRTASKTLEMKVLFKYWQKTEKYFLLCNKRQMCVYVRLFSNVRERPFSPFGQHCFYGTTHLLTRIILT